MEACSRHLEQQLPVPDEWSADGDPQSNCDGKPDARTADPSSQAATYQSGRAHGIGALTVDGDERGREGGRDAQPLRENTHRHASARQRHHISQLARPGGSCLPAAGAPSPYMVPIAAISAEITEQ
jgi:hypothetical protein